VQALAEAMKRLGSDPALRERMALAARARAEQYDWSRYHAALLERLAAVSTRRP